MTKIIIEKKSDCECMSKDTMTYSYMVVGYGEDVTSSINFGKKTISTFFMDECSRGVNEIKINFCPLCGRNLYAN